MSCYQLLEPPLSQLSLVAIFESASGRVRKFLFNDVFSSRNLPIMLDAFAYLLCSLNAGIIRAPLRREKSRKSIKGRGGRKVGNELEGEGGRKEMI